jgi:probable rRNA maturation factor
MKRPAVSANSHKVPVPKLKLTLHAAVGARYVRFLRKHLHAAHRLLNPPLAELSLALVGDARMSSLHKQFMQIEGPTDVLTFPLEFDDAGREIAGEVVVCVPEAARQARQRGTSVEGELLLYALHGMLHLSGFDDRTEAGFRQMHRMEDDILTHLGLGPVFGIDGKHAGRDHKGIPTRAANRMSARRSGDKSRRRKGATESAGV